MTQIKKKTLTVLGITLILLLVLAISFAGQSAEIASADSTTQINETQQTLNGVMANGKAPSPESRDGTAIYNEQQLQTFLTSGNGNGYLMSDFNFSWGGKFTGTLASENMRTLDGNGHTITLTATDVAARKDGSWTQAETHIAKGEGGNKALFPNDTTEKWTMFMSTFFAGEYSKTHYSSYVDVQGGLLGFLRDNQTIKNCNFVFNGGINNTTGYATPNSVCMGLIVGLSLGTIENCSLTVSKNVTFHSATTWNGNIGTQNLGAESRTNHTIAFGGFAGAMTHSNAVVANSKLTLNGNFQISIAGHNLSGGAAWHDPKSRCFVGGVVGWCANSAKVYNIVTEGSGNLDARCTGDEKSRTRALSGIVAAIIGGDNSDEEDSLAGKIGTCGIINGVINKWRGYAKFLTYGVEYTPNNDQNYASNTGYQGLVVGVTGRSGGSTDPSVSDIFMDDDFYTGSNKFSIAYDYTNTKGTEGSNYGRRYSTNIIIKDVLGQADDSDNYTKASDVNAYLAFSGTADSSPLWAVYDLKNSDCILWSKSIERSSNPNNPDLEYYYDKVRSISEAKQYNVTHTEISRGNNQNQSQNYTIKYTQGRAVYFTKDYPNNSTVDPETNKIVMPSARYGAGLTAPTLKLYSDKACTKHIMDLSNKKYWVAISSSNNMPVSLTNNMLSPDTYQSFLYLENEPGKDYSYIQFINESYRYVSYIYDDPDYQEFIKTHEGYEPVVNGEKQIDWQPRAVQQILPKSVSIEWRHASDIEKVGDQEISGGNIVSYGRYNTLYDGLPVVFDLSLPDGTLIGTDTCTLIYEYRALDSYTGEYKYIDSCVNAGSYKVVVTGLSNSSYALPGAGKVDYCIDFEIEARQIGFINKITAQQDGDTYFIKVPYEAKNIMLADEIEIYPNLAQANNSTSRIVLYNVLDKDSDILQFEYVAYGEGELNMRNVGFFEMRMSMRGGVQSTNYIMPEVTKYVVEIIPTDATLSTKTKFEYPYGFLVQDRVDPEVTATGVEDGNGYHELLTFGKPTYFKKINGVFEETEQEPFDAGEYQIKYDLLTSVYTNYNGASILVDVTIKKRQVSFNFDYENHYIEVDYGEVINGKINNAENKKLDVTFQRQTGENGIFAYEYSSSFATYKFILRDENGKDTDIKLNEARDAGSYTVEVGIDFTVGMTSSGWQIDENAKDNYEIVNDELFTVVIKKRQVDVEIKEVNRSYGDKLPELIGNANSPSVRAWKYAETEDGKEFAAEDNIVLKPVLSTEEVYASVGKYAITIPDDVDHRTGRVYAYNPKDENSKTYNTINNYIINIVNNTTDEVTNNELYNIKEREVKVKVFLNTNSVIYGDDLPECIELRVVNDKDLELFNKDGIELEANFGDVEVGSKVDTYFVGAEMKKTEDGAEKNYKLVVDEAEFAIVPKTLTIIGAELEEGDKEFDYDGNVHKPSVIAQFAEEVFGDDKIEFNYNYFEIVDGVMSTEATENPSYAGTYRAFISDASNENYTIVFGEEYTRLEIIMKINKRDVTINVLPAYRIYSVEDSLTPILRPASENGGIHPNYEEEDYHYFTQDEAMAYDIERYLAPFDYVFDNEDAEENEKHKFVQDGEYLQAKMYIDEYYRDLGVKQGVVKIVFNGLEQDPNFLDEDGNWITEEAEGYHGDTIQIIVPRYRNYNVTINPGDLHVIGADLENIEQFVNLRSSEEVYNGQDRYEDFRVITSNTTIFNALKFRVFRYVAISSLTKAEADALARDNDGKYTRETVDGKYVYTRNDAEGLYVRKYIRRIENGDTIDEPLVNAGQYFKHVTPVDSNIFQGEYIMDFYITKADREVSADDIKILVNYNQISLSSKISGMEVSFDGAGYVSRATFAGLKANTPYVVKVRFAEAANYKQSEELVFNLRTGIDISSIKSTLEKFDKINFSNIDEYESKVLAYIDSVSQADLAFIDQAKYAKLQASYEQLLRGANTVIAGAQKAGATAVGKSGKTSSSAKAIALSMSGVSVLAAGFMFFAKKKREDEQVVSSDKKASFNAKRASKIIVAVVAVMLVCLTVFAGCNPVDDGKFSKADLYRIASYQSDSQSAGNRDLTIEVKSGGKSLYKYENGKEEIDPRLDVSSMAFGADGIGFEFDDLYFVNEQFEINDGVATFNADIKETLVFLGVDKAVNGKVNVAVDVNAKKLNSIDVSYDVVNAGITYSVTIAVKVK
ncbi:MAG: hypothetical protein K2M75_05435 [Clostridia bacterium]|nr:hypothetical protein [Clostridia bacterium]